MENVLLKCGQSLDYICSCIYISNANKDTEKRDYFAKYLLDNGVDKTQIKNGMATVSKNNLPKWSEVVNLYNELQVKTVEDTHILKISLFIIMNVQFCAN